MTENQSHFLGSELDSISEDALFHILPVPFERTVSYGGGTALGPQAIIESSHQLELFDGQGIPAEKGIFTHPPVSCSGEITGVLDAIERFVSLSFERKKIPVLLGGEHTVTVGALGALKKGREKIGIVQFDAHADLRNAYQGTPYSHACVMRRAFDLEIPIFQIGIRSLSHEEHILRITEKIPHLDAAEINRNGIPSPLLPPDFPDTLYLTLDVDALDPAIMPSTGTPEPGGLSWYQMMACLENVVAGRRVAGFDVVELAPVTGNHGPDFTAAKLVYSVMGIITRNRGAR